MIAVLNSNTYLGMTQIERICSLSSPGVTYAWDLESVSAIDHKWDPAVDEDLPE